METKKGTTTKLDSALALTRSESIQQYHVFAYILANDLDTTDEGNPVYGSIIILGSFSDYVDEKGKIVSGKKAAIKYANNLSLLTRHDLIFWTDTHKWFNLRKRAKVGEVLYVDDKTALENAIQYNNLDVLKVDREKKKMELSIEEEKALHRSRSNPDHIEHFIDKLVQLNSTDNEIEEYEKKLKDARIARSECIEKLKFHYQKHPKHAEDAMTLLKTRLEASEFLPVACTWSKYTDEIASSKIYEKKGKDTCSLQSSGASRVSHTSVDLSSTVEADIIIDDVDSVKDETNEIESLPESLPESIELSAPQESNDKESEVKESEWKTTGRRRRRGKK